MHEVYLERAAERDLKRLTPDRFYQIAKAIKALGSEPRPRGARKISGSANDWRIKIGTYRIVYEVDDSIREVRVLRIRHRRDAYN